MPIGRMYRCPAVLVVCVDGLGCQCESDLHGHFI